ncbi:hypothetical protein Dacsa_1984 [Dactylococcopsis salina PCC 8305]|uniref:Uncharacterized protein n=1 Tax=Dactylococcopsis salina (strain PCC 8305) TaxID=13035 RepID=K9YUM6_DACS8|nr:hypothetical protein Dacsa_1984 [Dactylococcopsis salina PCC 8305]
MERLYIGHCNGWSEAKPNTNIRYSLFVIRYLLFVY